MGIIASVLVRHNQQTGWWEVVDCKLQKVVHVAPTQDEAYASADRYLAVREAGYDILGLGRDIVAA